jgi:hypothetical protein
MSYRRSNLDEFGIDRWRIEHRMELLRWLPAEVVGSFRSLNYVLLHAEDDAGTGWTPEWLQPSEAKDFLAFLEREFSFRVGYDIFLKLKRRAND